MANPLEIQHGGDHYKKLKVQPIEYAHKNNLDPCEFSVIKYVTRHRSKNGLEDLKKAMHFLQMEMMFVYGIECVVTYGDPPTIEQQKEEPLLTPIMSFNKDEPTRLAIVPTYPWPAPPVTVTQSPIDQNIPPFLEEVEEQQKTHWEVFPVFETGTEGKIVGYRVGTKTKDGNVFVCRHYLTDEMNDSPSLGWCQNAAERQAEEFNQDGRSIESFGIGYSKAEKTSAEGTS